MPAPSTPGKLGWLILLSFVGATSVSSCGTERPEFKMGSGDGDGDSNTAGAAGDGDGDGGCLDGTTRPCGALGLVGTCAAATATCKSGEWVDCPEPKNADSCEPGNDDNCDGSPNEGCPCQDGDVQDCGLDVGACLPGQRTCVDGEWSASCEGGIEPEPRDCSSPEDNDCDGKPDNAVDEVCKCLAGSSQNCEAHPGMDGVGPCRAGTQTCEISADKMSSDWNTCSGSVGPQPEGSDTCEPGNDNDCDGMPNDTCKCIHGEAQTCDCGGSQTCQSGMWSACSVAKVEMWKDADGDMYGDSNVKEQVCPGSVGYVSNDQDCHDDNANLFPGASYCDDDVRRWCEAGGGAPFELKCRGGCINGECRTDGAIGVAGWVTCSLSSPESFCSTTVGCNFPGDATCGTSANPGQILCDGPSDCPGQICCQRNIPGANPAECFDGVCPDGGWLEVCDPQAPSCQNCVRALSNLNLFTCQ